MTIGYNIWEIIQNIIGWFEYLIFNCSRIINFKDSKIVFINHSDSHVFGKWIFINSEVDDINLELRHEYGHRIQSKILGPLYLFVIYIPSLLHYIWFVYKYKDNLDWGIYYKFYTEKSANYLTFKK